MVFGSNQTAKKNLIVWFLPLQCGSSLLHEAAVFGSVELGKLLVAHGADPSCLVERRSYPVAVVFNHSCTLTRLLSSRCCCMLPNNRNLAASFCYSIVLLQYVCCSTTVITIAGSGMLLLTLLRTQDSHGRSPFMIAAIEGRQSFAQWLIELVRPVIDDVDEVGRANIVCLVIHHVGVRWNVQAGCTAFHSACARGTISVAQWLVTLGANPGHIGKVSVDILCEFEMRISQCGLDVAI